MDEEAEIEGMFLIPWVVIRCTICGPFTSGVHVDDINFLEEEADEYLRVVHGRSI